MGRPGFFRGQHHTDEAKRRISAASKANYKPGFLKMTACKVCAKPMNVANIKRHQARCEQLAAVPCATKSMLRTLKRMNLTVEDYLVIAELQGNKCAICRCPPKAERLALDHDHDTDKFRGLLCDDCNFALGLFKDDIERIKNAVKYLERSRMTAWESQ